MAGDIGSGAPSRRYVPRGHPISWWMLLVTTGAIPITSVAGIVIDNFGFAINYVVLAIPCLIALIPLAFMRETRVTGGEAAQE